MRLLFMFLLSCFLLAESSVGQVAVISGYASNWTPPGIYAAPFVPLLKTPSVSLDSPTVGTGPAFSESSASPVGIYTVPFVPLLKTPSISLESAPIAAGPDSTSAANWRAEPASADVSGNAGEEKSASTPQRQREGFHLGAALSQDSFGVAELAKSTRNTAAAHLYTNEDVENLNRTNGQVSFDNKTERLE